MGQVRNTRNIRVLNSITNYQLRIWAGYLNQPVSRDMKKQLIDKAHVQGKQMVKVSIAKGSNKKTVIGPQFLQKNRNMCQDK